MSPRTAAARVTAPRTARTTADRAAGAESRPTQPRTARTQLRVVEAVPARRSTSRAAVGEGERRGPFALLVVALLVTTTLGLLFLNTAINVNSVDESFLRAQNADLAREVQSLQRRVVLGGTPAELAEDATDAGLVPAGSAAYLVIAPDGSSTLRGSVTPAPEPVKPSRVPADRD